MKRPPLLSRAAAREQRARELEELRAELRDTRAGYAALRRNFDEVKLQLRDRVDQVALLEVHLEAARVELLRYREIVAVLGRTTPALVDLLTVLEALNVSPPHGGEG